MSENQALIVPTILNDVVAKNEISTAQENKENSCLNNNSIIPALKESERFVNFLIKRFKLQLPLNFIVVINKDSKNALGSFAEPRTKQHFINSHAELNTITLNTLHLKHMNPYEVLTHELAHYINFSLNIKDCSANQYHNKHFKTQAEFLLLQVTKTNKGYNQTEPSEEFNQMLNIEFKPEPSVFNVFQAQREKKKVGSRLRKYTCDCNIIIRTAHDDLKAKCLSCGSDFRMEEND